MRLPWYAPLVLLTALALAIVVAGAQCRGRRAAEARLGQVTEAASLAEQGFNVSQQASKRELAESIRSSAYLKAENARLAKAADAKPIATFSGRTGPRPIAPGVAITVGGNGQAGSPSPRPPDAAQATAPGVPSAPGAGPAACAAGQIRIPAGAVWRTEAGNTVAATTGEAWCASPEALLFSGPVTADISTLSSGPLATKHGAGLGVAIIAGPDAWGVGPVLAAPPLRVLGLQFEAQVAATVGRSGGWGAAASVIGRRR